MKKYLSIIILLKFFLFTAQQTLYPVGQYHSGCATINNGVKIKTNIPFTPSYFPTVVIEGYAYGASTSIGVMLNWYVWENKFYGTSTVSSFGSHTPKITLGKENYNGQDNVVIFIDDKTYCLNFSVRSNYTTSSTVWSIVDEPLMASTTLDLPYKNSFKGEIDFGTGIWTTNGSLGVGTKTPETKLDVTGTIRGYDLISGGTNAFIFHTPDDGRKSLHITPVNDGQNNWNFSKSIVINDGNMLVSGKLEAKEVKVTTTPTADFVFAEDYQLPTLEEVEKHIKEKKHLPAITSAKEMEKEGVNVGEFQIKLLQKIEELTLYSIEQNKQNKSQEEQLNLLKEENKQLKTKLKELDLIKQQLKQLISTK